MALPFIPECLPHLRELTSQTPVSHASGTTLLGTRHAIMVRFILSAIRCEFTAAD